MNKHSKKRTKARKLAVKSAMRGRSLKPRATQPSATFVESFGGQAIASANPQTRVGRPRGIFGFRRKILAVQFAIFSLVAIVAASPVLFAFEGHVIKVTAKIIQLDPPVITPGGGTYSAPVSINITDGDIDVTDIYYTVTSGTDPNLAPDPVCGVSAGGGKPRGPILISNDSVVKAVGCDGTTPLAHHSTITTEIYLFVTPYGIIEGHKYHDLDESGSLTTGDTPIQGWHISLMQGPTTTATTITDEQGFYVFDNIDPGTYTVKEEMQSGWQNISPQDYIISVGAGETKTADFFNLDSGFACIPESVSFPANLALQVAGSSATSSNDDLAIANNVTVNGDVRSNDSIQKNGNSNGPRTINGNAKYVNSIDSVFSVTGTKATSSATSLPNIDIPTWKQRARDGGTVNGSFIFPNSTTGLVMGPTEIMGDLTFGSSNTVTVKGPLYIHGNLTIGSNSSIVQDVGLQNEFSTIIVDGTVSINANDSFVGSGSIGTFLLVSTHSALATSSAISLNSNSSDLGRVVLYASNGDIHVDSNRTFLAAFAAHGTGTEGASTDDAITIDSNVTVNYRTLPTSIACGPRQPYESTSHILINEFLPNPAGTGTDQGTVGLPHNGEWVELFNPTNAPIDITGYVLYDSLDTHDLPITTLNTDTGTTVVPSHGYLVVYRDGDTDFELNNTGGDTVRLFNGPIGSGATLVDSHSYVRDAPDDKSFSRIPDGASNWVDPSATPGRANDIFFAPLPGKEDMPPVTEPYKPPIVLASISIPEEELQAEDTSVAPTETEPTDSGLVLGEATSSLSSDSDGILGSESTTTSITSSTTPPIILNFSTSTPPTGTTTPAENSDGILGGQGQATSTTESLPIGDTSSTTPQVIFEADTATSTPPAENSDGILGGQATSTPQMPPPEPPTPEATSTPSTNVDVNSETQASTTPSA